MAKKKIAIAKKDKPKGPFFNTPFCRYLNSRIGAKPKLTATDVAERGGVSMNYISELKNGKTDPAAIGAAIIKGLADGLDESPCTILRIANDETYEDLRDEDLEHVLKLFSRLDQDGKNAHRSMVDHLKRTVREYLRRSHA